MILELSRGEVEDLREVLETYVSEFRDEVTHTDNKEVRAAMRARFERLKQLQHRLSALTASDEAYV